MGRKRVIFGLQSSGSVFDQFIGNTTGKKMKTSFSLDVILNMTSDFLLHT